MSFEPRLTAPEHDNPYYTKYSPYWQAGKGMPNCTAYSYGRINELKQVTSYDDALARTHLSRRNARKWWDENDGYARGQAPQVGAVAVFQGLARTPQGDTYGHVMVVEAVDGGVVTLSGSDAAVSGSSGRYFYVDEMTMDELRDPSYHGGLLGFIYAYQEPEAKEKTEEAMSMDDARKLVLCDYIQYLHRLPAAEDVDRDSKYIVDNALTTAQYDHSFLVSQEYSDRSGSMEAQDFVIHCYMTILGRFPESFDTLDWWCKQIADGLRFRDVAYSIYYSDEAKAYRGES